MSKRVHRCDSCGKRMRISDEFPAWTPDEFDIELALSHGRTDEWISQHAFDLEGEATRYRYIYERMWMCDTCDTMVWDTGSAKWYFNVATGEYDITEQEQA